MKSVFNAIKIRINELGDDIADGISSSNWRRVACSIGILLLMIVVTAMFCVLVLMGLWWFFQSFWGRKLLELLCGIGVICLLCASYRENLKDQRQQVYAKNDQSHIEVWAEDVYEYVRDAVFLVLRAASDYSDIIMPTSPGTIELPNGISIKDGYAVFNFFARVRSSVDIARIQRELNRTLSQMIRAHELKGIPAELVLINGAYYSPLLIMDVLDYGDSINIAVAFADERTVGIAKARKQLSLERFRELPSQNRGVPYDDEI